jgi:uncharacterized membrane protein
MDDRRGERIGWTFGWTGGFLWVAVLAVVVLAQGRLTEAAVGLVLLADALVLIVLLAPWRRPDTPYWKLMLPLYITLFASAAWAIWIFGGAWRRDLSGWNMFLVVPILLPFGTIGRRRWRDRDIREP